MCKYCEDCKGYSPNWYREFTPNGGARIIFDPEDVGFLLQVSDGYTYSIIHCPWCGRKLEKPKEEQPFAITKEQYEKLAMWLADEHSRINRICNAIDAFLDNHAARWLDRTNKEQLQRSLRKIRGDN